MKKALGIITALFLSLGAQAKATIYFQSDFNGLADSTTSVNGGLLTLSAYGEPVNWGIHRSGTLTIYGGGQYNGAVTGFISGLASERAAGNNLLRMTGSYQTKGNYDNSSPWSQTAEIQFQNGAAFFSYNSIVVGPSGSGGWQNFTLDLDLAGLATDRDHINEIKMNFFIGGNAPGEFQVDNLRLETIPEPSSAALMGLGVAGLLAFRMRRKV